MCLPRLLTIIIFEKATGGGAYKFADLFKERLGVSIEKEDEMNCLVAGANFLLKVQSIQHVILPLCPQFIWMVEFEMNIQ